MKRLLTALLALILLLSLAGCGREETDPYEGVPDPVATITLSDGSVMRAELYPRQAPNTVGNFIALANSGFYDGLEIFRVVPGVFVQTGDPLNDGTGGPGYAIRGEFSENGYEGNTLSHTRGVLSMCHRLNEPDSAGSQFFIMQGSFPTDYDGQYAAFGKLMDDESLSVLDALGGVAVDANNRPLVVTKIDTIRVDTHGYSFPFVKVGEEEETAQPTPQNT